MIILEKNFDNVILKFENFVVLDKTRAIFDKLEIEYDVGYLDKVLTFLVNDYATVCETLNSSGIYNTDMFPEFDGYRII